MSCMLHAKHMLPQAVCEHIADPVHHRMGALGSSMAEEGAVMIGSSMVEKGALGSSNTRELPCLPIRAVRPMRCTNWLGSYVIGSAADGESAADGVCS